MNKDLKINKKIYKLLPEVTVFGQSDEDLAAKRQIRVIAASGRADRVGDIVKIDGIELGNYKKNPVVLYGHDHYGLPIGQAVDMAVENGKLVMIFQFATAEEYAFADTVYRLVKGKYIRGVSIGARVIEAEWIKDEDGRYIGRKYNSLELLEVSIVAVPADSKALITAVKSGACTEEEFEEYMQKTFEAPLDSDRENSVSINTDDVPIASQEDADVDKAVKEQLQSLETRIASLEDLLKKQAEVGAEAKKSLDALQTAINPVIEKLIGKKLEGAEAMQPMLALVTKMLEKVK